MGTTNRRRPQYLTQAMANAAIGGNMLQTVHSGANPTWNQPLSSDSVQLSNAHYLQSFAFQNGTTISAIVFNLSETAALPITFSGANAPTGSVQMTQITSANLTDNNETAQVVTPTTQTLSGFNASAGLSLPPFSMTVLTWSTGATTQAPAFSVAAGSYSSAQSVSLTDATSGAAIYYTTDGSTPTTASSVYSTPITVTTTQTINAIAVASGLAASPVSSAAYQIAAPTAATPVFSVAAGNYTSAQKVNITDATAGATIYYTTNGTVPTTSSTVYSGPITVGSTETLEAIAVAPNYSQSAAASATYTINLTTANPAFSVAAGTYATAQTVTITDSTPGATIYYSTNGTTGTLYSGPVTVSATQTLQAVAIAPNYTQSSIVSATYTINLAAATPVFSVAAGTYTSAQTVSIVDATAGATIYYTTNGATPTTASTKYAGPITVGSTETLQAVAIAPNYSVSAPASAAYTINLPAATPVFSVAAGTYTSAQTVSITDATAGATIYYTTNGSTPTTSSTVYAGPITVGSTETLQAIAIAPNSSFSAAASATYTINIPVAPAPIALGNSFAGSGMIVNGYSSIKGSVLQLTNGGQAQQSSAWYPTKMTVSGFTTDFDFQLPSSTADGFTFTIQNNSRGIWAMGGNGGSLGYEGITKSVAVAFDLYGANGETQTVGVYTNGASPSGNSVDMTSAGINLHNGHVFHVHLVYAGTTLTLTLTDSTTKASFTKAFTVNIASSVGASTAYVGFTGSTGAFTSVQNILDWTFKN